MESTHDRIINGLLKADLGFLKPEEVQARLSQDVVIRADPKRTGPNDLWPCIWFLAAVLERQFTGQVVIHSNLATPLPSPIPLSSRCVFVPTTKPATGASVSLECGTNQPVILGDARGNELSYGRQLNTAQPAHPIAACALAGYLGFSALAHAAGIPPFRTNWQIDKLRLPFALPGRGFPADFAVLGTGQVGQAFLALAYFLAPAGRTSTVHLVDKDEFEEDNLRTQVLLTESQDTWCGRRKVDHLAKVCQTWGWSTSTEATEVNWGWRCLHPGSSVAFLGFDNMDARRIGVEGGFPWLFECGVGTDFCQPRVTWHSLPPDRQQAKELFGNGRKKSWSDSPFATSLGTTAASCGRVTFENIEATAPSLGLVATAFTWAEILNYMDGNRETVSGTASLWSPFLPIARESRPHRTLHAATGTQQNRLPGTDEKAA